MKPWQPGDPVGAGAVYLPDNKTREAYGKACQEKMIEAWADLVVMGATLQIRQQTLAKCPASILNEVKLRVRIKWSNK